MHYLSISFSLSLTPFCITTRTYTRTHCNLSVVEDLSIWIKAQPGFVLKAKSFVLGIPYSCTSPQLKLRLSKLKFPVSDPQPHPVTILTLVGAGDTIDFAHRASLTCALAHSLPLTSPISPLSARPRLLATAHTHTRTRSHTHASAHTHTHTHRQRRGS